MYIECWFCMIKYIFCIKNNVNTNECAFNLGEKKTCTLLSVGFFKELFRTLYMLSKT